MASNIKGITIEIGGDTTELSKALTKVNGSSRSLQSEYWKRATGAVSPQAQYGTYPERITYGIEAQTSAQYVRLRSAGRGYGCSAWLVYASGDVNGSYACYAWRCAPACVIC